MRKHEPTNGHGGGAIEQAVPPLCSGDKLSLDEFLRRWEQHPEIKFAELIGGIVYMPSPLTFLHGESDSDMSCFFGVYAAATVGVKSGQNSTTFMAENSPQPDGYLRILPEYGGNVQIDGKYLRGAAELIGEVCVSSTTYDLNQKFDLYESAGVQEYLAILLHEQEIRWHRLTKSGFKLMPPDADDIWKSKVFPGLWLDGNAMLAHDSAQVLATLQLGLQSPEHAAFVKKLAKKKKK